MTRYAIVDLSNLFARARHVTIGDAYTKAGMALAITFRSLRKLHRDLKVRHIVVAVDKGSWRYDAYPMYKARRMADRQEMKPIEREEAEVFLETLTLLIDYLTEKTRCTVLSRQGIEGDDFVARWTQVHPDDEHIIVSGDSDFVQLLGPKVSIYDGVQERMITTEGVTDPKGERMAFQIDSASGKVKVPVVKKPNPDFVVEPEWWRKALFVKIVRGDSGDGIFSAYPGITFKGSSKRVGIQQAWDDREEKGFHWNNFMLQTWQKATGVNAAGEPLITPVRVIDEFRINEGLIDLTRQPEAIKERMDVAIAEAIEKAPVANVGLHFLKFCSVHDLPGLTREANDHAAYLNAPYPRDEL